MRVRGKRYGRSRTRAGNAWKQWGFREPKALQLSPVAAHPVAGLSPALLLSAGAAVHGPVAFGEEAPAAEGTPFPAVSAAQDLRAQLPVSGEDGGAEVFADQCGGNELRTGSGVAVVQRQAVSSVIVGAQAADGLSGPPELAVVHAVQLTHDGSTGSELHPIC